LKLDATLNAEASADAQPRPGADSESGLESGPESGPGPAAGGAARQLSRAAGSSGWLGAAAFFAQLDALSLFAATLLLLLVIGSLTQRYRPGPAGIALTEVFAILLPALMWSRSRRRQVARLLGLRPPLLRQLAGGVLLGAALFFMLAVWIEPVIERLIPVPAGERQQLLRLLHPSTGLRPFWQDLLCFAIAPAVCEEVLFRGAILAALLGRASPVTALAGARERPLRAVVICAILFGAFHLSWANLLPTAVLGLGFGAAAVRSRSLWPAMVMHLINNGLVIYLVRRGHEDPPVAALSLTGALTTAAAVGLFILGARLCRARPELRPSGQGA
jgi:sodium transport system permease protein